MDPPAGQKVLTLPCSGWPGTFRAARGRPCAEPSLTTNPQEHPVTIQRPPAWEAERWVGQGRFGETEQKTVACRSLLAAYIGTNPQGTGTSEGRHSPRGQDS